MLKITKISGNEQKLVKTSKVYNKSLCLTSNQWLEMAWSPSGEQLFVAGDNQLAMFARADDFVKQSIVPGITHTKDISHVRFIAETCLVTASIDKWVKVWHLPTGSTSSIKLVAQFKTENELMQMKYSPELNLLAYLDSQCSLGTVYLTESLIIGESAAAQAAQDDIDLEAIDAAMIEDEDDTAQLQMDNIDMDEMKDALSDD